MGKSLSNKGLLGGIYDIELHRSDEKIILIIVVGKPLSNKGLLGGISDIELNRSDEKIILIIVVGKPLSNKDFRHSICDSFSWKFSYGTLTYLLTFVAWNLLRF